MNPALVLSAASLATGLLPKKKGESAGSVNRRWMGFRPNYQLTDEDEAFGERRLGRTNEIISRAAQQGSENVARRYRARGLGGPAEDQALADIGQGAQVQRREAGADVSDLLDRIRQKGLDFERTKGLTAWNAELNQAFRDQGSADAQQAMWWNSQLELLPMLLNAGKPPGVTGIATPGGHTPGSPGGPRRPEMQPY